MTVVGRARVLAELAELLAAARTGTGSVALLTGEAGIGTSTVADALVERARSADVPVLIGRAVADAGAPAYWPWRRALAALGLSDDLLDVDVAGGDRSADAVAATRFRIADGVWRALAAAARPDGLLLLVEDVQWLDEASAVLLRQVCREVADGGVLVLGTARSPAPDAPAVEDLAGMRVVRLGPFTVEDVAASVAEIAGGPVDPSWPAHLHRLSGGNPLFVRELARLLATEGRLGGPVVDVPVPAELRRVAMRRMDRLGAAGQDLLGVASVIGDEIDVVLLTSIVDADRRADVPGLVAEAVAAGVLVEEPDMPGRVRFSHELVRRARYDELSRVERVDWHRRVADTVEAAGYSSSRPGELARHRVRAAVDEAGRRAAGAACRGAALAASAQLAFGEATRWYDQAAALLDAMPDSVAPRGELLVAAADSAYRAGQFEVALDRCTEAMGASPSASACPTSRWPPRSWCVVWAAASPSRSLRCARGPKRCWGTRTARGTRGSWHSMPMRWLRSTGSMRRPGKAAVPCRWPSAAAIRMRGPSRCTPGTR